MFMSCPHNPCVPHGQVCAEENSGMEGKEPQERAASTQLPINRPSAIGDQSLPFRKVLSVTGIELKPRT